MTRPWIFFTLFLWTACDTAPEPPIPSDPETIPTPRAVAADDFTTTATGLKYYDFKIGTGDSVKVGSIAHVHYHGWLTDSTLFDTSYLRQEPFVFLVGAGNVIPGWDEGVMDMQPGGHRQLIVPPELAYGERGNDLIPPNATLIFELLLIDVE